MKIIYRLISAIQSHPGKKALGKALSISALNQAVSSGTNFALGIYLMRMLTPLDFGLYGIGFAISLFYSGFGHALFLIQMVVHMPDKAPEDRLPYAGRMFLLVAIFCIFTIFLTILFLIVRGFVWGSIVLHEELACAILASSVAYLLKDFFVRHAYNLNRETWVLAIHVVIACTMFFLLWLQSQLMLSLSVETALWIYAVAQASGAILGYLLAKLPVADHKLSIVLSDLREAWYGGRWPNMTNLVFFARTQAHTIVVTLLLGPVGVAKLNAARLLVTPAIMFTPALSQVAIPRLAAAREQDVYYLIRLGRWITFSLLMVALLYSAILLSSYDFIADKVLTEDYRDFFLITALWCLYTCFLALRNGIEMIGQVLKKFKQLSIANMYSAVVSLIATYWLTVGYGLPGTLIGLIAGEISLILLAYGALRSLREAA